MTMTTTTRIYVASLAAYNAGRLVGEWIDAAADADTIREQIAAMLAGGPGRGEEYAVHDYDGFGPAGDALGEYPDLADVSRLAGLIGEHGEVAAHVYADERDADRTEALLTDGYRGAWDSLADYVAEFYEDCHADSLAALPDALRHRIDWDGVAHDWECGGDVTTYAVGGQTHVFDANV